MKKFTKPYSSTISWFKQCAIEIQHVRGIYWNVAHTTSIIFYVETKISSNFEVSILYTGLIYHRDCPERMCFPAGDPYIQTSCSLRGRLEYTPLGLDGYWSMYSNGELFKWWIAPYSRSTFFWKHINNISMYSLTCCAKMDSQIYVIHHKTRNNSQELLHSPSWW